jgi:hypothetical protein
MTLAFQLPIRPALPNVYGSVDFRTQRAIYARIDDLLRQSDVELPLFAELFRAKGIAPSDKQFARMLHGFRCAIARRLCGLGLREFSARVADSHLLQWFTHCGDFGIVAPNSKSTQERYEKLFDGVEVENLISDLICQAANEDPAKRLGGLNEALDIGDVFADCTCVKAPIHFPVDWVLLVDTVRSLMKAVLCIRKHGLRHRMPEPESFLRQANALAMSMASARRAADGKKRRKKVLRALKRLNRVVEAHARRYRDALDADWEKTDWTRKQAEQVLARIDVILEQIPAAIHQAHERVIGERKVPNGEKILSLYEPDAHVLVRGKSGAEVEFGNKLYLAEQRNGVLVDWAFFKDAVPTDSALVEESVERMKLTVGKPGGYVGDRGFDSQANVRWLKEEGIRDGLCARNPEEFRERRRDPWYAAAQKRRGGTEARVGVFKNVFLRGTPREKGFDNRKQALVWCVLAHNLWVLARLSLADEADRLAKAA